MLKPSMKIKDKRMLKSTVTTINSDEINVKITKMTSKTKTVRGGGTKNVDLSECVWTYMTINLKQIVTVTGKYIWTHENHKSKAYNRYTKKRKKYKHATEENYQTTARGEL